MHLLLLIVVAVGLGTVRGQARLPVYRRPFETNKTCCLGYDGEDLETCFFCHGIERYRGLNILLSVPHGGLLKPNGIQDRRDRGCCTTCTSSSECIYDHVCNSTLAKEAGLCRQVINNDGKTQDLADRVFHKIKNCTGFYPMMIVMNLHRSKLDVNRRLAPATFGDEFTARIYNEYHGNATLLADAMTNATNSLSTGLGVDIHGFKDNPGDNFGERSSLGYKIRRENLVDDTDLESLANDSSLKQLALDNPGISFTDFVKGSASFGSYMEREGLRTVPSPGYVAPLPGEKFYRGTGNPIMNIPHVENGLMSMVQLEIHTLVRWNETWRKVYAEKLARAIVSFYKTHYDPNISDCDSTTTTSTTTTTTTAEPTTVTTTAEPTTMTTTTTEPTTVTTTTAEPTTVTTTTAEPTTVTTTTAEPTTVTTTTAEPTTVTTTTAEPTTVTTTTAEPTTVTTTTAEPTTVTTTTAEPTTVTTTTAEPTTVTTTTAEPTTVTTTTAEPTTVTTTTAEPTTVTTTTAEPTTVTTTTAEPTTVTTTTAEPTTVTTTTAEPTTVTTTTAEPTTVTTTTAEPTTMTTTTAEPTTVTTTTAEPTTVTTTTAEPTTVTTTTAESITVTTTTAEPTTVTTTTAEPTTVTTTTAEPTTVTTTTAEPTTVTTTTAEPTTVTTTTAEPTTTTTTAEPPTVTTTTAEPTTTTTTAEPTTTTTELSCNDGYMPIQDQTTCCKNIAYKRPTYQKPRGRRDSYKAVDGILISSSKTGRARKTLWRVKLPGLNKVKVVSIQSTAHRLRDITVYVGKAKNPKKICGQYRGPGAANEKVSIYCTRALVGKYVKIVKRSTRGRRFLSLSEVSVCGKKVNKSSEKRRNKSSKGNRKRSKSSKKNSKRSKNSKKNSKRRKSSKSNRKGSKSNKSKSKRNKNSKKNSKRRKSNTRKRE